MNYMGQRPFVSVVVPALNCADEVDDFAACMRAQTYPAECFEVLLIDNGSDDDTFARASRAGLTTLRRRDRGRARALNTGVAAARGEYLLTTDMSCRAAADWIESVVATFAAYPDAGCVAGDIRLLKTVDGPAIRYQERSDYMSPLLALSRTRLPFLPFADGANASFPRRLFDEIGGFEESFIKAADVEICYRLLMLTRHSIIFNRHALVWEPGEETLGALLKQRFRMGIGTHLLRMKYPALYASQTASWDLRQRYWKLREAVTNFLGLLRLDCLALLGSCRHEATDANVRFLMSLAQGLGHASGRRRLAHLGLQPQPVDSERIARFLIDADPVRDRIKVVEIPSSPATVPAATPPVGDGPRR